MLVAAAAGSTDGAAVEAAREVLAGAGAVEAVTLETEHDLEEALERLEGRTPVVAGGDGTLHVVAAALDRRGALGAVPLGLVPLGTGNDLARGLGLPLEPGEAAGRIAGGTPGPVDLLRGTGEMAGAIVLNAAHAGIGVTAAEHAAGLKEVVGGAAYAAGAARAGIASDGLDLRVEVDGEPLAGGRPLLLVGVGNGCSIGGGTLLFPDADPADGLLEVVAVDDRGVFERLRLGLAARLGTHLDLDGVHAARGREVAVAGEAAWNDDGELGTTCAGRALRVDAGAWSLVR